MNLQRNKLILRIIRKLNNILLCSNTEKRNIERLFKQKATYNYVELERYN